MSQVCTECNEKITKTNKPGLQCFGTCSRWFHIKCIKLPVHNIPGLKANYVEWRCEPCKKGKRQSLLTDDQEAPFSVPIDLGNAVSALQKDIKLVLESLRKNELQLANYQSTQEELIKSLQFQIERTEDLEKKVEKQAEQLSKFEIERSELKDVIMDMRVKFDEIEQSKIERNIEIQGIPVDVPPEVAFEKICSWVNCDIADNDVINSRRLPNRFSNNSINSKNEKTNLTSKQQQKQPNVIVTLASVDVKKKVLQACRARQPLVSDIIGSNQPCSTPTRIYVNEELTRNKKRLLNETKRFAKENEYRYVWIKEGNILMRKNEGTKALLIKSSNDFFKYGKLSKRLE